MAKKRALPAYLVLPISILAAAVSALFYARALHTRRSNVRLSLGPADPSIRKLLQAYEATRDVVEAFPPKPPVKPLRRIDFAFRSYLRFITVNHIKRVLNAIKAHYHAKAALGEPTNEQDGKAVEDFLLSLPDISLRRIVLLTASVGIVLAAIFSIFLKLTLGGLALTFAPGTTSLPPLDVNIDLIVSIAGAVPTFDMKAIVDAFKEAGWLNSIVTLVVVIFAFTYALFPPQYSYSAKRILFSLYPDAIGKLRASKKHGDTDTPRGIYSLEDDVFHRLGSKKPHEMPLDLLIRLLTGLFLITWPFGIFTFFGTGVITWAIAIAIWGFVAWASYFIRRSWKKRQA